MSPRMGRTGGSAARALGRGATPRIVLAHDLYTWGSHGGLGVGSSPRSSPVAVGGTVNWAKVGMAYNSTFGIKTDGTLWTWGSGNAAYGSYGALGTNEASRSVPTQLGSDTNWSDIALDGATYSDNVTHNFAIKSTGALYGTGRNDIGGPLGMGDTTDRTTLTANGTWTTGVAKMAGGYLTSALLSTSGSLYTAGNNGGGHPRGQGSLGLGDTTNRNTFTQVGAGTDWTYIAAGGYNMAGIKSDGTLWTWGNNGAGALGYDSTTFGNFCCRCINGPEEHRGCPNEGDESGRDGCHEPGETSEFYGCNAVIPRSSPVQVGALTNWASVSVGVGHMVAVKTNGTLWAWGQNTSGQLGDGTNTSTSSPVQIGGLTTWAAGSAGAYHNLGLKTDGTLWAWGRNTSGQLGDGTTTNRNSPVQIGTLTNWAQIECGQDGSAAIT